MGKIESNESREAVAPFSQGGVHIVVQILIQKSPVKILQPTYCWHAYLLPKLNRIANLMGKWVSRAGSSYSTALCKNNKVDYP